MPSNPLTNTPFSILSLDKGQLRLSDRSTLVTRGAWMTLSNADVLFAGDTTQHFAPGKKPTDPRRVMLLEQPPKRPTFIRVCAHTTSTLKQTDNHPHKRHQHESDTSQCCCLQKDPTSKCWIAKTRLVVDSAVCLDSQYCCAEPSDSPLWALFP